MIRTLPQWIRKLRLGFGNGRCCCRWLRGQCSENKTQLPCLSCLRVAPKGSPWGWGCDRAKNRWAKAEERTAVAKAKVLECYEQILQNHVGRAELSCAAARIRRRRRRYNQGARTRQRSPGGYRGGPISRRRAKAHASLPVGKGADFGAQYRAGARETRQAGGSKPLLPRSPGTATEQPLAPSDSTDGKARRGGGTHRAAGTLAFPADSA